jgi:hypothetical protein
MNRSSRFFFMVAGLSALIAVGLAIWLLRTMSSSQPSYGNVRPSESTGVDLPITPEPARGLNPTSAKPATTMQPSTPRTSPSLSPTPTLSPGLAGAPVPAKSADNSKKEEKKIVEAAKKYLSQSLHVNPERGDKFTVLDSQPEKLAEGEWTVNLKAYLAHPPPNGFPGLLQELIVERITLSGSSSSHAGEPKPSTEELLHFHVCRLHLKPSAISASRVDDRKILERVHSNLLLPPTDMNDGSNPYFRDKTNLNELTGRDVQLVVEDESGKRAGEDEKSFQDLGFADVQVLIAWSVGKNYPHLLILKRIENQQM